MATILSAAGRTTVTGRSGYLATLISRLSLMRQRRALAQLDEARLSDLGLTNAQAHAEAARPIWDAPGHWRA